MAHLANWHRPWVHTIESVLGHVAAIIIGFVMMVVGLGLGVTMVMLPAGIVIGLAGVAIFIGGLLLMFSGLYAVGQCSPGSGVCRIAASEFSESIDAMNRSAPKSTSMKSATAPIWPSSRHAA